MSDNYGKLPFDIFVLAKWDYSRPTEDDQQQWDDIARQWLALNPRGRHSYRLISYAREGAPPSDPRLPTAAQMARVLAPHQTAQERALGPAGGICDITAWVRTCYDPSLAGAYAEVFAPCLRDGAVVSPDRVLDSEALYSGMDLQRLLLRAPAIPDAVQYSGDPDDAYEEDWDVAGPGEEFKAGVYEAQRRAKVVVYLVDEEAARGGYVKVLWLDEYGECVWDNRIRPGNMMDFTGHLAGGNSLGEFYEGETDPRGWERGTELRF